jgi:dipeptidyl aminopeptidase/acylaminoacyl peptidase
MATKTRPLEARDLLRVQMADDPQISPDGSQIAWVHTWMDSARDSYRSAVCVSDVATGEVRRVSGDIGLNSHPRWSPDGQQLAFLATQPQDTVQAMPPQLCLVPARGGAASRLAEFKHGAGEPAWSPNGRFIACTTMVDPRRGLETFAPPKEADDLYERYNQDVLVVRRRNWKMDGFGYRGELRRAVVVVDVGGGTFDESSVAIEALALGAYDLHTPRWSPDGTQLAVVGNLDADADAVRRQFVYLVDLDAPSAPPRKLAGLEDIRHTQVAWSPDGRRIALSGHNDATLGHYGNQQLWTIDVDSGALICITAEHDCTLGHAAYTDVGRYAGDDGLLWLPNGRHVLALISQAGTVHLARIDVESGEIEIVTTGDFTVAAFSVDAAGERVAALIREALNPADIFQLDLQQPAPLVPRQVTAVNADWLAEIELSQPEKFQFRADDVTVDAWILPPVGRKPGQNCPVVLYTGGGPAGMRAANFLFEYQLLAAQGYALLFCNARGCQGYGQDFCTAILGAWGGHDFADNMRCLDEAVARFDFVDSDRVGMAGGSYGGYLVNWALGHTDRFRATVSDRSVFNRHSSYGTSDIGHLREFEFDNGPPWETGEHYRAQSPLSYIGAAATPTLVVHSAQDLRCAVEQGEQLYLALKRLGVPTKLIRFPNESHGLSRGGRPWHRIFRLQAYLDWFEEWL